MSNLWNFDALSQSPPTHTASGFETESLRPLFFDALPWRGKPTRTFAWLGFPQGSETEKVPGIVLVHGGDGTAFADWVRLWNRRGYAAIAMDTCGNVPHYDIEDTSRSIPRGQRHEFGGPNGWGGFDQIDEPEKDQWPYHAVANVLLAHSLLRAQDNVDPERIGITGISWGGFLTCISAGIDFRFRFAAPVYGCGFIGENSMWLPDFARMGKQREDKWLRLWDPSNYLRRAQMPFLWLTGTNDIAYPLDSLQKSYSLPTSPKSLSVSIRMPHGHGGPGENPEEVRVFADSVSRKGTELARIKSHDFTNGVLQVQFESAIRITNADLIFSRDSGPWVDRLWETTPAAVDAAVGKATCAVPEEAAAFFLNLKDERSLVISTELIERMPSKRK